MKEIYLNTVSLDINFIICLCHIVDEYKEFCEKLDKFLSKLPKPEDRDWLIYKLFEISYGKDVIIGFYVKKFYNDNKNIIDTINKYIDIKGFANWYNTRQVVYFYKYILENKDKLDKIIANLEKIKKLGFSHLTLGENIDFSFEECLLLSSFSYDEEIEYLENMEAIPTYSNVLRYKSNNSSYKIVIRPSLVSKLINGSYVKDIRSKKIIMNDLTIDSDRLPEKITYDIIVDKIISLKDEKKEIYDNIRNSVNLAVGIEDLQKELNKFSKIIDSINDIKTKEELVKLLLQMKGELLRMKTISQNYDKNVVDNNEFITEILLEQEKKTYLKRREDAKIDLC